MGEGLKIQFWEMQRLKPYPKNSKVHDPEQIKKLAAQINEHGFDVPIVIDGDGVIIKGHARLRAAQELGLTVVPVIVRDDLTPRQVRLARIADNKLAESPWDFNTLKDELQAVDLGDIDLSLLSGFSDRELQAMFAPDGAGAGQDGVGGGADGIIIQYQIIFDTAEQQECWYKFIRFLKEKYPDAGTIAERLTLHIADQGLGS